MRKLRCVSGIIWTNRSFDREARDRYEFFVTAVNKRDSAATATATVIVNIIDDSDEPPRFTQRQYVFVVAENRPAGSTVGHVTAVDRDLNHRPRYYVDAQGGADDWAASLLGVDEQTGRVYTRRALDRERRREVRLTLTARDALVAGLHDTATVVVRVADDNDQVPVFRFPAPGNDTAAVRAGVPAGGRVARLVAVDRDAGDNAALRYSITAGNEHRLFAVDRRSGWVVANGSLAPYARDTFRLVVSAEDGGASRRTSSATLFVVVGDAGGPQTGSNTGDSAGLVAQLLQVPVSGTRLVVVVGLALGLCVVIVAVCVTVCACRLQRRRKLDLDTLKRTFA